MGTLMAAAARHQGGHERGSDRRAGNAAVENRFHVKNLHATMLTQLGFDPNSLSCFYSGLHQKLSASKVLNRSGRSSEAKT